MPIGSYNPFTWQKEIIMPALRFFILMVVGCLSLVATPAWPEACRVNVTPLAFGTYDVFLLTAKSATAQVTIICNHKATAPATVQLTLSPGSSGNIGQRGMTGSSGGLPLYYNIYATAGLSAVLGDGTGGSTTPTALVDRTAPWVVTLYGSIPARQSVLVGTYSDSLVATLNY
jgi:spore coat protein U-like protein